MWLMSVFLMLHMPSKKQRIFFSERKIKMRIFQIPSFSSLSRKKYDHFFSVHRLSMNLICLIRATSLIFRCVGWGKQSLLRFDNKNLRIATIVFDVFDDVAFDGDCVWRVWLCFRCLVCLIYFLMIVFDCLTAWTCLMCFDVFWWIWCVRLLILMCLTGTSLFDGLTSRVTQVKQQKNFDQILLQRERAKFWITCSSRYTIVARNPLSEWPFGRTYVLSSIPHIPPKWSKIIGIRGNRAARVVTSRICHP